MIRYGISKVSVGKTKTETVLGCRYTASSSHGEVDLAMVSILEVGDSELTGDPARYCPDRVESLAFGTERS